MADLTNVETTNLVENTDTAVKTNGVSVPGAIILGFAAYGAINLGWKAGCYIAKGIKKLTGKDTKIEQLADETYEGNEECNEDCEESD